MCGRFYTFLCSHVGRLQRGEEKSEKSTVSIYTKELDLTDGFELTGTLSIDGPLPAGENTQFEFNMGYAPPGTGLTPLQDIAVVPSPTAALAGLAAPGVLTMRRRAAV